MSRFRVIETRGGWVVYAVMSGPWVRREDAESWASHQRGESDRPDRDDYIYGDPDRPASAAPATAEPTRTAEE